MSAEKKYLAIRSQINNGDIALFRGVRALARIIQWGDAMKENGNWKKAYYNHCALIFKKGNRLLTIDSVAKGVQPHFLSHLMRDYSDFCIIRPEGFSPMQIDEAVEKAIDKADEGIKYDKLMLLRIGLYRRFGLDTKKLGDDNKDTCSEFTGRRYAVDCLGIKNYEEIVKKQGFITPEDHKRYLNNQLSILFDDSN